MAQSPVVIDVVAWMAPALAARYGSISKNAVSKALTADATLRSIDLSPGGYRLYGAVTATFFATRLLKEDGSAYAETNAAAPTNAAAVGVPAVGTPAAGAAWDPAAQTGGCILPVDVTLYEPIAVPSGFMMRLYVVCPGGTTNPRLVGAFA